MRIAGDSKSGHGMLHTWAIAFVILFFVLVNHTRLPDKVKWPSAPLGQPPVENPGGSLEYKSPCYGPDPNQLDQSQSAMQKLHWGHPRTNDRQDDRIRMAKQIERVYGFDDERILQAIRNVPRHWFVPRSQQSRAYYDSPLPIGHGQTISQPFIVAYMTSVLNPDPNDRILEIGTGSGYQAAMLNEFTPYVYTIEIVEPLGQQAAEVFEKRGYKSIQTKIGDGYLGWPEFAPFDGIIVTCAPENIPQPLIDQLKPGGRMIIPVGSQWGIQELVLVTKDEKGKIKKQSQMPVRFVPLIRK